MKRAEIIFFTVIVLLAGSLKSSSQEVPLTNEANCHAHTVFDEALSYFASRKYDKGIRLMQEILESSNDSIMNSLLLLYVSRIYYIHGDQSASRESAYKALDLRPDWGYPHLQLGKLSAMMFWSDCSSSAVDKYVLISLAMHHFEMASTIDSLLQDETKKFISIYERFLPTENKLSQLGYHEGQIVNTECWPEPIGLRIRSDHPPLEPLRYSGERWRLQ